MPTPRSRTSPRVLFDALVLPDGEAAAQLVAVGHTLEFIRDQYRHCKTILALGAGQQLLAAAGVPAPSDDDPAAWPVADGDDLSAAIEWFVEAVGRHRHPERDRDPPPA